MTEGQPQNLALIGPSGDGKSALARQIGAYRKSHTFEINAYSVRSADEWYGLDAVERGRTTFRESLLVRGIETTGATVIIHDLALGQNRTIQNGLNDLLEYDTRRVYVEQMNRYVHVAPQVLLIACWNIGVEYTGNITLSRSLEDRFPVRISMERIPADVAARILIAKTSCATEVATALAQYANIIRDLPMADIDISMRGLLNAAEQVKLGGKIIDVILVTFLGGYPVEIQEAALQAIQKTVTKDESTNVPAEMVPTPRTYERMVNLEGMENSRWGIVGRSGSIGC